MKKYFLVLLAIISLNANAQTAQGSLATASAEYVMPKNGTVKDYSYFFMYGDKEYKFTAHISTPSLPEELESLVCKEAFFHEGTYKDAVKNFVAPYQKTRGQTKNALRRHLYIIEEYTSKTSGIICIRYNSIGTGSNPFIFSNNKYLCIDVKNKKVVNLRDMITEEIDAYFTEKGFNTHLITNINLSPYTCVAKTDKTEIKIEPYKFYKNMNDYGLSMFDINREQLQNNIKKGNDPLKVYDVVETMPQFPGGSAALIQFLSSNIKYPKEAEEEGIQGRVICKFIVGRQGEISKVEVSKGIDPLLDHEAVRVIKSMPRWIPGQQLGTTVNVQYTLPITFRLK